MMLDAVFLSHAECHYAQCRYTDRRFKKKLNCQFKEIESLIVTKQSSLLQKFISLAGPMIMLSDGPRFFFVGFNSTFHSSIHKTFLHLLLAREQIS